MKLYVTLELMNCTTWCTTFTEMAGSVGVTAPREGGDVTGFEI